MKSVLSETAGDYRTLQRVEMPEPEPAEGEVLVRIARCSINFPDVLMIQDLYQVKPPRPFIPGGEISGVVVKVGAGVDALKAGDGVFGAITYGGLSEYVSVAASRLWPMGELKDYDSAATLVITYGTSFYALSDRGRLKGGERLLVLGASGGCGRAAVELGRAMGAYVVAGASTEAKVAEAIAAGANEGFVYPSGRFDADSRKGLAQLIKTYGGDNGFDVVLDPVGGDYTEAALRSLGYGGRLLVIGFPAGIAKIPLNLPLLKSSSIVGVHLGGLMKANPQRYAQIVLELRDMFASGRIAPNITQHYPLDDAAKAIGVLAERAAMGKVIVDVWTPADVD